MGIAGLAAALGALAIGCGDDGAPARDAGRADGGGGRIDAAERCASAFDCDDDVFCNGEERCSGGSCVAGEPPVCDDGEACTRDLCSEEARACVHPPADADGDGHGDVACGGDDCDDSDPVRHAGATELCDAEGRDEDCNPDTYGYQDLDGDGFVSATCCNGTLCGDDCADMAAGAHPGLPEVCDGRDNDCDGESDEEVMRTFWEDVDGDGYAPDGDAVPSVSGCFAPDGWVSMRGDCAPEAMGVHPGAYDSCDPAMIDEDCSGTPNDPPAGCACLEGETRACPMPGFCATGRETCTGGTWATCSVTPAPEVCNGSDDDCDGMTDDGVGRSCWTDADRDGWAPAGAARSTACTCPGGTTEREPVAPAIDCDDASASRSPAVPEICDGTDQDCDGAVDDGLPVIMLYRDADGDGYAATPAMGCLGLPGTSPSRTDCHDANREVYPDNVGWYATPYCPAGYRACRDASTMYWLCTIAGEMGCSSSSVWPSFDYDCDGAEERPAPTTPTCSLSYCEPGAGGCGGMGWTWTETPPACGTGAAWYCLCSGSICGRYTDPSSPLPCR